MDITSYLMGRSAGSKSASTVVVEELPETGQSNVIYLVPKQTTGSNDIFDEYIWVNSDWELIGSTAIDISGKQDTMQFNTMPTASTSTVGKIVQYTGTTNNNYTNGYFYIGTSATENDVTTYSWNRINLQPEPDLSNYATKTMTGALANLDTTDKTNLVNAINEVAGSSGNVREKVPTYVFNPKISYGTISDTDDLQTLSDIFTDAYAKNYDRINILVNYDTNSDIYKGQVLLFPKNNTNVSITTKPNNANLIFRGTFNTNTTNYPADAVNVAIVIFELFLTTTWNGDICTVSYAQLINASYTLPTQKGVLTKNNTTSYTPTANYHPATKKYVDDSIASAITTTLGGSY